METLVGQLEVNIQQKMADIKTFGSKLPLMYTLEIKDLTKNSL